MLAAERGDYQALAILIKAGANCDAVDDVGQTALMIAVSRSYRPCVVELLNAGAALDGKDNVRHLRVASA